MNECANISKKLHKKYVWKERYFHIHLLNKQKKRKEDNESFFQGCDYFVFVLIYK